MNENEENLILEHLRAIRGTQSEHGERLNRIELRLSIMEQTLDSPFHQSQPTGTPPQPPFFKGGR